MSYPRLSKTIEYSSSMGLKERKKEGGKEERIREGKLSSHFGNVLLYSIIYVCLRS